MVRISVSRVALLGFMSGAVNAVSNDSTVTIKWLGDKPDFNLGTTFGVPWPQGKHQAAETKFSVTARDGSPLDLQTWVTGHWSDGSVKWTGHAIPATPNVAAEYSIRASPSNISLNSSGSRSNSANDSGPLEVTESSSDVAVDTGKIHVSFPRSGKAVVASIKTKSGKTAGQNGRLVLSSRNSGIDDDDHTQSTTHTSFESSVQEVSVEKSTGTRALVTVRGNHRQANSTAAEQDSHGPRLPFVIRFYLYANSERIKVLHSIVFDSNATRNSISSLGLRFDVPLAGEELYDRHVRISGVEGGFLNEAVQGLTGLRRDPGQNVRSAQYQGKQLPSTGTWDTRVSSRLRWIPAWNDYRLSQLSPDGFTLKKRTKKGQGWIKIPGGTRSDGLAYLGGATQGGLAVNLRDFWKRYPSGLDVSNAASDVGSITLWLYSPVAEPLDLRPFHDGLGENGYEDQLDALEITYEDWEGGFNTPYGIARSSEISLFAFEQTPSSEKLAALVALSNEPPVLVASPEYLKETKALGEYWGLPDASSEKAATVEKHLEFLFKFYRDQVEQRRWYGFLDYGDFMHTYDEDRHTWRYDVGGYAWDNSELSPDLFFWLYFLRTGRPDAYRLAEALTRHTSEVDVYHLGQWKGLGTRHGVQHWGDSAKQARISQPQYRKYFFYLSGGDERIGELVEGLLDTDKTYGVLDPQRKVRTDGWKPTPNASVAFSLGTDWSALAAGWLLEWERRGPRWEEARTKLTRTVTGIAALKNGFVTGSALYSLQNASLTPPPRDPLNHGIVDVSHLSAVFGLPEIVSELIAYFGRDLPDGFAQAWLDYCYFFNAASAEQTARYGSAFGKLNLHQAHSRLTAFAAHEGRNGSVARRAWSEFFDTDGLAPNAPWNTTHVDGSAVLVSVDEAAWLATNDAAQYGLAAIQNLAYARDALG